MRHGREKETGKEPKSTRKAVPAPRPTPRQRDCRKSSLASAGYSPRHNALSDMRTHSSCWWQTILSAHCTDERVNKVTPGLFQRYLTPQDLAALHP